MWKLIYCAITFILLNLSAAMAADTVVYDARTAPREVIVWRTTSQDLVNNGFTTLSWSQVYDPSNLGAWSAGAPTRITVPSGYTHVRLTCVVGISLVAAETERYNEAYFYLNGAAVIGTLYGNGLASITSHAGGTGSGIARTRIWPVVAGDYLECYYKNLDVTVHDWSNQNFTHMSAEFWP